MQRTFTFISTLLFAVPLALSQAPGPAPSPGPMPGPPGVAAGNGNHQGGPDHGMRGRDEHNDRGGRGHEDGGREGLGGLRVPPGTWWRNAEVVSRVGLSADQVKKIDGLFLESRVQLIHLHATLEEEQVRLEPLLAANPLNEQAALGQISKIADTRADLEKADAKMLLSIRGVLTGDQWTKLQQRPAGAHGPAGPEAAGPGNAGRRGGGPGAGL